MAIILVADDEEIIRALLRLVLTSAGHHVIAAANGLEAVALFRSYASRIDLVITDLMMPVMDGYQLVRLVHEDRPRTRIICMSGYADQGIPPGVTMLPKPFLPDQLKQLVDSMVGDEKPT